MSQVICSTASNRMQGAPPAGRCRSAATSCTIAPTNLFEGNLPWRNLEIPWTSQSSHIINFGARHHHTLSLFDLQFMDVYGQILVDSSEAKMCSDSDPNLRAHRLHGIAALFSRSLHHFSCFTYVRAFNTLCTSGYCDVLVHSIFV